MKCKAAVYVEPRRIEIQEFEIPNVGEEDILIKSERAGICGTDVKMFTDKLPRNYFGSFQQQPHIMGDENVGRVTAIGHKASRDYNIKEGDRVIVEAKIACNKCRFCLAGYFAHCTNSLTYGVIPVDHFSHALWGCYSEYIFASQGSRIHKIPDSLSPEVACITGSVLANGIRWAYKGQVKVGDTVVIIGPGPQGLASALAASEMGAENIIVAGKNDDTKRLKLAVDLGADITINVDETDLVNVVEEITHGKMADAVIECVGVPDTIKLCFKVVGTLGRIVLVGITNVSEIEIPTSEIQKREINVIGGRSIQSWCVDAAISMAQKSKKPIERIISHIYPLEEAQKALEVAAGLHIKKQEIIKVMLNTQE